MILRIADRGLRNEDKRFRCVAGAALVALLMLTSLLRAQPPDIRADVEGAPKQLALSGSMRVTLTLEGPKPLRVELPKQLLTADANVAWRIRPDGPVAFAPAANGREQWRQTYRLDAYMEGQPLVASFNPITVNGQSVTWPPIAVEVTKSVGGTSTPPRAPVGVEEPPPPPKQDDPPVALWMVGAGGVVFVLALIAVFARKRRAKPVPPHERALAALEKLLTTNAFGPDAVEHVANVLRTFVEQRFAIPATKLTTTELLDAAREHEWPAERAEPLRVVLDACDRAKFAADVPEDGGRQLVLLAVDWIADASRPAESATA